MTADPYVSLIAACLIVVGFVIIFKVLRLPYQVSQMGKLARGSLSVMADVSMEDEDKEKRMQKMALQLFALFFTITVSAFASLFLPVGGVWLADQQGLVSFDAVLDMTLSWEFILGTTVVGTGLYFLLRKKQEPSPTTDQDGFEVNYSSVERTLHDVAFATTDLQSSLSKLEDKLFAKSIKPETKPPVFIAGLPRAGTTLLMELCYNSGAFATHTYRQMPFVLLPLLWNKFSKKFATNDKPRERAHGDGMLVSLDSPEAFEEMLWVNFWPLRYKKDGIKPWSEKGKTRFETFFTRHREKVIALNAQRNPGQSQQYISKNNLNIARVPWILKHVEGCKIILPFREPYQHCGSLLKQHKLFLELHPKDPFAKNYMRAVGHFDFGENLNPVNFDNWLETNPDQDTTSPSFWLRYWVAAYESLLRQQQNEQVCLFDFDAFCENPKSTLEQVASFLEMEQPDTLVREADKIRSARKHPTRPDGVSTELLDQVDDLYNRLKAQAINS